MRFGLLLLTLIPALGANGTGNNLLAPDSEGEARFPGSLAPGGGSAPPIGDQRPATARTEVTPPTPIPPT